MLQIRIRLDPFYFGLPYPDHETDPDPGSKEICQNHGKFPQRSTIITRISCIFFLILNFCLTEINIYLINNKTNYFLNLEKYIFDRKKSSKKVGIFSILGRIQKKGVGHKYPLLGKYTSLMTSLYIPGFR